MSALVTPEGLEVAFPDLVDSTMRADFVDCPQKFFQSYILKRQRKGGNVHLTAGGAYAKGLELVRRYVWGEGMSLDAALVRAIPYVVADYGDLEPPPGYEHKSCTNVIRALTAYFDRFPPETDHIRPALSKSGKPVVEFTFSFPTEIVHPTTGMPILYGGRFDMVGVYNDLLWVVDDKTATSLGPAWDKSWRLRAQLTGYVFAAKQFGFNVTGAIIRGCSFIKATKEFPHGSAFGFSEPIEYRVPWQIDRWWTQLHRDLARMVACWEDRSDEHPFGYWDWNLADACTAFGGCPFAQLCEVPNPDEWAKADFEPRTWNPLEKNPIGQPVISVMAS